MKKIVGIILIAIIGSWTLNSQAQTAVAHWDFNKISKGTSIDLIVFLPIKSTLHTTIELRDE